MTRTAADDYQPVDLSRIREIIGYPPKFIEEKKTRARGLRAALHRAQHVLRRRDRQRRRPGRCEPEGRPPGAVKVLDSRTLAIPDRPGNKAIDTFRNLVERPGIGVLFLVPGVREVLRVNGDAFVTDDPNLLDMLAADGKPAVLATIVRVQEVFYQCGKALIRSRMWNPDPGLAEALLGGANFYSAIGAEMGEMATTMGIDVSGLIDITNEHYETTLY